MYWLWLSLAPQRFVGRSFLARGAQWPPLVPVPFSESTALPLGDTPHLGLRRTLPPRHWRVGPVAAPRLVPYLENCRASTSNFYLYFASPKISKETCCSPSYKMPTVDALAPDADEGRGRLRKATGSRRPDCDPWMSEWGNPAPVMGCDSRLNT